MQVKKILLIAGSLAALSFSQTIFAYCMSVPDGWYVEGNVGSTRVSNVDFPGDVSNSGVGGNLNVGYKFMPYFGAEIGYTRYANGTIRDDDGDKAASITRYSYDIAARGIVPLGATGAEAFAKLGVARLVSDVNIKDSAAAADIGLGGSRNTATGLYLGAGAQYYVTPEFAIVGQWQRAQGSNSTGNFDLISLGISFIVT